MKVKKYFKKVVSTVMVMALAVGSVPAMDTLGADGYTLEIPYQFDNAWSFSDGVAVVVVGDWAAGDKSGYIDKTGTVVIPYQFKLAGDFSEGLAVVGDESCYVGLDGGNWGYIDKTGTVVIPYQFNLASGFSEGLAMVRDENYKWGYIDKTGMVVIPYQFSNDNWFSEANGFSEGLAGVVGENGKWGYIDKTGTFVTPYQFSYATPFSDGLASVQDENGKWGYIDKTGTVVIPYQFSYATPFSDGLASVYDENGKSGYIDKTGTVVIPYQFNYAWNFSEGLAVVGDENGKWGYIDKTGTVVIPYQFSEANDFSEGLANVKDENGKWGYIDKTGTVVIPYQFNYAWNFSEGLAVVGDENYKWGYISSPYATTSTTPTTPAVSNLSADPGYEISKPIGTLNSAGEYVVSNFDSQEFVSVGEFNEFQNVYLNDELLEKDVDYTAVAGSTKITIKSQTMQTKAVNNSTNTIKAEFKNSQGEVKKATETFKVAVPVKRDKMSVVYNGKTQEYDPIVKNGTSYIKARELVEQTLGGKIYWDNGKKEVTVVLDNKTLVFTADSNTYYFDGVQKTMTKNPGVFFNNGYTYVPVRFICEAYGMKVGYNVTTNVANIDK